MIEDFGSALHALHAARVPDADLSGMIRRVLGVSGVSVASFGDLVGNESISASDDTAFRIDELQFDLHEGPCWDAIRTESPVLAGDIRERPGSAWPAFVEGIRQQPVGGLFAFPVAFGPFRLGAVDLYTAEPTVLEPQRVEQASALASAVSRRVLQRALESIVDDGTLLDHGPFSRRVVHQATGVVLAQLDITPDDAYLLIQGHAFARRRAMREIAEDILGGRLRFEHRGELIEEAEAE